MNTKKAILSLLGLVAVLLVSGCGTAQSRDAMYVRGLTLTLYPEGHDYPMLMDVYHGPNAPDDDAWKNCAFVIAVQLTDVNNNEHRSEGVRIDARRVFSANYVGQPGIDVFSDGERGYFTFSTGIHDTVEDDYGDWICTRADNQGRTLFLIGVGDSGFLEDVNHSGDPDKYIKPGDMFSTIAEFQLRVRSNGSGTVASAKVHCVITKSTYQHFVTHQGVPGVFNVSWSALGPYETAAGASESSEFDEVDGILSETLDSPPLLLEPTPSRPSPATLIDPFPVLAAEVSDREAPAGGDFITLYDALWLQERFDPLYGWFLAYDSDAAWTPRSFMPNEEPWQNNEPMPCTDPNSPNAWLQAVVDTSQPPLHLLDVGFPETVAPDAASCVLRVNNGMDPNDWMGDAAQDADFYPDGKIDLSDLAALNSVWLNDQNSDPNANVFIDQNGDLAIDQYELSLLCAHWLQNNIIINNNIICAVPLYYRTIATNDTGDRHYLATPYLLPVDDARFQGWYVDSWGNPLFMVHMPEGARLEISPVKDGDVNGDGAVNLIDYAALYNCWRTHTYNPAFDVNTDGVVDAGDLRVWVSYWRL